MQQVAVKFKGATTRASPLLLSPLISSIIINFHKISGSIGQSRGSRQLLLPATLLIIEII